MKKVTLILSIICMICGSFACAQSSSRSFWFDQPANLWTEALPVGNGKLGAMVYGRVHEELIKLNESSIWAGGPYNSLDQGGAPYLDSIRNLVFAGKGREAEALFEKTMMGRAWMNGEGIEGAAYQPLGNLRLVFPGPAGVENYRRELLMDSALVRVSYSVGDVNYRRTIFTTAIDSVMVVRLEASKPGHINAYVQLEGISDPKGQGDEVWGVNLSGNSGISLKGQTKSYPLSDQRLAYEGRIVVKTDGGKAEGILNDNLPMIKITNSNSVTLYFTASTNYTSFKSLSGDPVKLNDQVLGKIATKEYTEILREHVADFSSLFNRVSIKLGPDKSVNEPINVRFNNFALGSDPDFAALYYQYGRYLLISSSRFGGLPANLQGIWNEDYYPAWNSGYTTNINFEMNYWSSDLTNLSECREPQLRMIRSFAEAGAEAARRNFNADGWVSYCATDLWNFRSPIYGAYWGGWHTAGAWFCNDLWDHFLFTGDTAFLKDYYPVIRDAALFFNETLVKHPKYGWWVTNPSGSPENGPGGDKAWKFDSEGKYTKPVGLCAGSTIDNALVGELFDHFTEASKMLGLDDNLRNSVSKKRKNLPPYQIGQYGQLQEWLEDLDLPDDHHRHTSHLWGLYPGTSIDPLKEPKLSDAAKITLKQRGDQSTGWSMAWKINFWARLRDGNHAYTLLSTQLKLTDAQGFRGGGGTYINLMDAHPPFQIDGNLGATAGITEMLLQSHNGYIEFLPALPDAWDQGHISGIRARGGFEIDLTWENKVWKDVKILSDKGLPCILRSDKKIRVVSAGKPVAIQKEDKNTYRFKTTAGQTYAVSQL